MESRHSSFLSLSLLLSALLLLALPLRAAAQLVGGRWDDSLQWDGALEYQRLGTTLLWTDDLDGDGLDDFVTGFPFARGQFGGVSAVSPATGRILYTTFAPSRDSLGAAIAQVDDLDGDGVPDLAVGATTASYRALNAGAVYLLSGASGRILRRLDGRAEGDNFGFAIAAPGDVDLDGSPDLLVGAPGFDPAGIEDAGAAYLLSLASGQVLRRLDGWRRSDAFGKRVAVAGDVDQDGVLDLAIAAPWANPGGDAAAGSVALYSGASGNLIRQFHGEASGAQFGWSLARVDDLDGDEIPDLLIGAPMPGVYTLSSSGRVYAYAGSDGGKLFRVELVGSSEFGSALAAAGDLDDDGRGDFLVGEPAYAASGTAADTGRASLYSGRTQLPLREFVGGGALHELGAAVAGGGDLDGNGLPDLLLGAPGVNLPGADRVGRVRAVSFDPYLHPSNTCLSLATTASVDYLLDFPASAAAWPYRLLASATGTGPTVVGGLTVPLSPDALFQGMLGGWSPPNLSLSHGVLDAYGDAVATLTNTPPLAAHFGATLFLAAVTFDPSGVTPGLSSTARRLVIVL